MQLSKRLSLVWIVLAVGFSGIGASAQSVASGTIEGTVVDSTGGVVVGATVEITNPLTGFQQTAVTDAMGVFRFMNIPFNPYHIQTTQKGFEPAAQDVNVRTSVPIPVKITLSVAGLSETVRVEAGAGDIIENVPYAHADVDVSTLDKLPMLSPASGLSDAIMLASPGVVADSNGFFHPLGDHAQTSFAIDGQPINDQQSKAFSTQVPVNAIQNMEIVTGTPNAEFGDKTSLVVNATTRSGLALTKPRGEVVAQYGSFGSPSVEANVGIGGQKAGWFSAANGLRSGRFLDTPAVHECAVSRAEVGQNSSSVGALNTRVMPRHHRIVEGTSAGRITTDYHRVRRGFKQLTKLFFLLLLRIQECRMVERSGCLCSQKFQERDIILDKQGSMSQPYDE